MALVSRHALSSSGAIVLLNGTSSSGKTSLAKALQLALPKRQFLHVQLNAFRDMEPEGYFSREEAASGHLRVAALCRAMHATVAEYSAHGQNVVFDHVLSDDAWRYLFEDFDDQQLYLVAVRCGAEELVRREHARGDRPPGLAQSQLGSVHKNREYDFSVDTTASSPSECAATLVHWLKGDPAPSAFSRMRTRQDSV